MKEKLFTRNFTLLILGQVSSLIGNYSLKFALSMYILEQTGSASVFAGITAVSMLPMILFSPFGGILADRADRRNIMVALDMLSGLCVLSASFLLPSGKSLTVIGLLLVILSVLGAFESPTVQACVPQMLAGNNILKGNAIVSQVQAVASLIAPFSGSIFYTAFGIRPVLYASAVCFFLTALLECFIRLEYIKSGHKSGIASVIKTDFSASMQFLFREQTSVLKLLLLAALISMFLSGILMVGFPYLVRTVLGLSAEHYGAAESAMGIAAIAGSIAIGVAAGKLQTRYMTVLISVSGICLFPAGLIFITSASPFVKYLVLLLAFCCCQFICSMFSVYALSLIQQRTPEHLTGKVMSYVYTISLCAQPVGQMIYGVLFDVFSDSICLVLIPSGILICTAGIMSSGFFRRLETF
ncbi:MAG TPA: MFS transporter [Candidatus Mediterraneibacter intestinigallinarum]|nr:MFS transporter [Candidatus Mediterraneibacter intestinigallinarum]